MNENLNDIFIDFLKQFDEKEQKKILISREQQIIAERKSKKLNGIRAFLDQFVAQGVTVYHKDRFNKEILDKEQNSSDEQDFRHYDTDSSEIWAPGISIWFDHPAEVEIAVPNDIKDGLIVIKVATPNPHSHVIDNKYDSAESACRALARFICLNTISISPNYKKILQDYEQKNNLAQGLIKAEDLAQEKSFLFRTPTQPPQTSSATPGGVKSQHSAINSFANKTATYGKDSHQTQTKHDKIDTLIEAQLKDKDKQKD